MTSDTETHRLVIAGAGIAGFEALAALAAVAPGRFDTTVLAPTEQFKIQATTVEEPFAKPSGPSYDVARVCADHGAKHVRDALIRVNAEQKRVFTAEGEELE